MPQALCGFAVMRYGYLNQDAPTVAKLTFAPPEHPISGLKMPKMLNHWPLSIFGRTSPQKRQNSASFAKMLNVSTFGDLEHLWGRNRLIGGP